MGIYDHMSKNTSLSSLVTKKGQKGLFDGVDPVSSGPASHGDTGRTGPETAEKGPTRRAGVLKQIAAVCGIILALLLLLGLILAPFLR